MRTYPWWEEAGFRGNILDGEVRGLGVMEPSEAHGSALVVVPARGDPHRAAPYLLDLPRPVFLDSSLTDGRGGRYSFVTADPFLTVRSWGRRVELTGPAGRVVTEEDPLRPASTPAAPLLRGSGRGPARAGRRFLRLGSGSRPPHR